MRRRGPATTTMAGPTAGPTSGGKTSGTLRRSCVRSAATNWSTADRRDSSAPVPEPFRPSLASYFSTVTFLTVLLGPLLPGAREGPGDQHGASGEGRQRPACHLVHLRGHACYVPLDDTRMPTLPVS